VGVLEISDLTGRRHDLRYLVCQGVLPTDTNVAVSLNTSFQTIKDRDRTGFISQARDRMEAGLPRASVTKAARNQVAP
jgi:hypothetical protein